MLNVCRKCHIYDKTVSANARLCTFLRLLYYSATQLQGTTSYLLFQDLQKKGNKKLT